MAATVTIETLVSPLVLSATRAAPPAQAFREGEREAIEASQRGEREAFDRLVERYQRDIYRLCYRYVNNHEDANDMAQEVFLKAYKAIGRFRGDSSFSTWFRAARKPETEELPEALPDGRAGAMAAIESEEQARVVRKAVSRLPDKQRATLILKVFHDLTHEEVAGVLGSTVGTVKANLFHALGNLRKQMTKAEE